MESLTFCSVDPGVNNSSCVFVKVYKDYTVEMKDQYEFNLKSEDDQNLSPSEILKKEKTGYADYQCKVLMNLNMVEQINNDADPDTIFVFEENDNKYTRQVAPILTGLFSKHGRVLHQVKPISVWSSMKRLTGWKKGDKVNREMKKLMTRRFIAKCLANSEEENSDDTNDAILNAIYMAKKMGLFNKRKKK
jgi:hypothetical protein